MAILTGFWMMDLSILLSSVIAAVYLFYKYKFQFWKNYNMPQTNPSIPFGDVSGAFMTESIGVIFKNLYDQFKGERFFGSYSFFKPVLIVREPELIKSIFVKDFMTFHDRGVYVNERDDPLSAHLFSISGAKWRNLRAKLSPTFTSGKMKMMFPIVLESAVELQKVLEEPGKKGEDIEIKEICARFTTDVISSCAFGIKTNSLKDPNAIFRKMGKRLLTPTFSETIMALILSFLPELGKPLRMTFTPKEVTKFFMGAVGETIDYREQNQVKRNDFMQLLIQLKNKGYLDDVDDVKGEKEVPSESQGSKFTFEEVAAQAFVFFIAGFETSSTTMQFALYELALNPDLQDKTRSEIKKALDKNNGELTYENVFGIDYLGKVLDETLRKYPPVPNLQRESNKDYQIPDTTIVIPKGIQIQIPIFGIQRDPEIYPDPEKFDPERFSEEEKSKRHHYAYLPFGEGPRNCIGMRFGLMQTRIGLITLLTNYKFEVTKDTPIPMTFDPKSFITSPKVDLKLKITALNN